MYIGYDHCPKELAPEADIVQHRLDFPLDFRVPDATLRHLLMYTKHRDSYVYTNSIDLATVLAQCKTNNTIPIIALNFFWALRHDDATKHLWPSKITPTDMARCARLIKDILIEKGFTEAYVSVLNEPTKWLKNEQIYQYSKAVVDILDETMVKILVGNDEFFPDMFDYLASRFAGNSNVLIGFHALSGMGKWSNPTAYMGRIGMMKELAANYKLKIIGNECGSWFVSYRTETGHNINKQIIMECKTNDYIACLIVLPDLNVNCITRYKLGYIIWDNDYRVIKVYSKYYNDFINFIKQEGGKKMVNYKVPSELKTIAIELGNVIGNYEAELPVLTGTGIWQNSIGHKRGDYLTKADFDSAMEKILKMIGIDISVYYNADGSWNSDWQTIAKSGGVDE